MTGDVATRPGRRSRRRTDERGVGLIELALVLPLLAVIVMGTVDLGRAYRTYDRVKSAAGQGALYASASPYSQVDDGSGSCTDPNNIVARVNADAGAGGLTTTVAVGGVAGTPATTPALGCDVLDALPAIGTQVSVTVTTPFTLLTPLISSFVHVNSISSTVTVKSGLAGA